MAGRDRSLQLLRNLHQRPAYLLSQPCSQFRSSNRCNSWSILSSQVVILDADLHPPELIPDMIEKWRQGYQVVYAQRTNAARRDGSNFTAYGFYRLLKHLADVDIPTDTGDFCLLDRQVVDVLNSMPAESLHSWTAIVGWVSTNSCSVRATLANGEVTYLWQILVA